MGDVPGCPKGMAFQCGKIFTVDIDPLVEVDIASGQITNRHRAAGAMVIFAQGLMLMGANGLSLAGNSLIVANLGDMCQGFDKIKPGYGVALDLTSRAITAHDSADPSGVRDGVEPDVAGGVLITDNMGGRLLQQAPGGEVGKLEPSAANLEFVADRGLVVVPLTPSNTVVGLSWGK